MVRINARLNCYRRVVQCGIFSDACETWGTESKVRKEKVGPIGPKGPIFGLLPGRWGRRGRLLEGLVAAWGFSFGVSVAGPDAGGGPGSCARGGRLS